MDKQKIKKNMIIVFFLLIMMVVAFVSSEGFWKKSGSSIQLVLNNSYYLNLTSSVGYINNYPICTAGNNYCNLTSSQYNLTYNHTTATYNNYNPIWSSTDNNSKVNLNSTYYNLLLYGYNQSSDEISLWYKYDYNKIAPKQNYSLYIAHNLFFKYNGSFIWYQNWTWYDVNYTYNSTTETTIDDFLNGIGGNINITIQSGNITLNNATYGYFSSGNYTSQVFDLGNNANASQISFGYDVPKLSYYYPNNLTFYWDGSVNYSYINQSLQGTVNGSLVIGNNATTWFNGTGHVIDRNATMFDGMDDLFNISSDLMGAQPITVSAWLYLNDWGVSGQMYVNNLFTGWTGVPPNDSPTWWSTQGDNNDPNSEMTQDAHGIRMYTNNGNSIYMQGNSLNPYGMYPNKTYMIKVGVYSVAGGQVKFKNRQSGTVLLTTSTPGNYTIIYKNDWNNYAQLQILNVNNATSSSDFVISEVSMWGYDNRIIDNGQFIFRVEGMGLNRTSLLSNTTYQFYTKYGGGSGSNLSLNKWQHVAVTRSSNGTTNYYINGILSGTANQNSGTPKAGTSNTLIGNGHWHGTGDAMNRTHPFNGTIDELAVWNRVLSAGEISALYNNSKHGNLKLQTRVNLTTWSVWSDYYIANGSVQQIINLTSPYRYLQYRALFDTLDTNRTPVLTDVNFTWIANTSNITTITNYTWQDTLNISRIYSQQGFLYIEDPTDNSRICTEGNGMCINGTGTSTFLPLWNAIKQLTNSIISQIGNWINIAGNLNIEGNINATNITIAGNTGISRTIQVVNYTNLVIVQYCNMTFTGGILTSSNC